MHWVIIFMWLSGLLMGRAAAFHHAGDPLDAFYFFVSMLALTAASLSNRFFRYT